MRKFIDVNKKNYKKYRYLKDYRNGAIESLTDEELKAQLFHLKDIYRGMRKPLKVLQIVAENSVKSLMAERGIK